jgi:hypothetical protein
MTMKKAKTWMVCQGSYGVTVCRYGGPFPGGRRWEGFRTKREADAFALLLSQGANVRQPDGFAVELTIPPRRPP